MSTSSHVDAFIEAFKGGGLSVEQGSSLRIAAKHLRSILSGQDTTELMHRLEVSCTAEERVYFDTVLAEALNIAPQEDGELSVGALPLVIDTDLSLPNYIPLGHSAFSAIQLRGRLTKNLSQSGVQDGSWTYILPILLDTACLSNIEAHKIVNFPEKIRKFVQGLVGSPPPIALPRLQWYERTVPTLYFILFIHFTKGGRSPRVAPVDDLIASIVKKWAYDSLPEKAKTVIEPAQLSCCGQPYRFTDGYFAGRRAALIIGLQKHLTIARQTIRHVGQDILVKSRLVGPAGSPGLLVSFIESKTQQHLREVLLPVRGDGVAELLFVYNVLHELGVTQHETSVEDIQKFVPSPETLWALPGLANLKINPVPAGTVH